MTIRRNISLLIAMALVCIGVSVPSANAQQSGSGLQLSPTRTEISAAPGEQKTFTISLKNITQANLSTQVTLNDFESDNVSGTPKILVDNTKRTPYSINSMLQGLRNVDLKPGETKEVKLTIDVPGNAAPGAYYGAVRYSVVAGANDNQAERQIALNASVAHLVFVEVPGNVVQQIKVNSLKLQHENKPGSFFFSPPDKAALSVQNLGNGFSRPFGRVTTNNIFGKQVNSYEVNNRDPRSIVLPNSARTFTDDVSGIKMPGRYTITASVAYGNGGEVVSYKARFWYMPVWFILILLLLVAVIVGGTYYLYRKRFSHKSIRKNRKQY